MLPFNKAYLAALGYTIIIGFVFIFIKIALQTSDPLNILAHRFSLSFLFLYALKKLGLIKISLTKKDYFRLFPLALFFSFVIFWLSTLFTPLHLCLRGRNYSSNGTIFHLTTCHHLLKRVSY